MDRTQKAGTDRRVGWAGGAAPACGL